MTYYKKKLELNNPHRKYMILLMNKIVLLVFGSICVYGRGFLPERSLRSHLAVLPTHRTFKCSM